MTYGDAVWIRERGLDLVESYQGTMVKEICKAKSFDVLLQTWRDLPLILPEFITLQLNTEGGEDGLYLPQVFKTIFSSALGGGSVISAVF